MEYKKICNVCGHIFAYTDEDIKRNKSNSTMAALSSIAAITSAIGGTNYNAYEQNKMADRSLSKVVDYSRCPNCGSSDIRDLTEKELADLKDGILKNGGTRQAISINTNASADALIKRGMLFLEDSDWSKADAYFENALDADPTNSSAYIGKMLVDLRLTSINSLETSLTPIGDNPNYQKALRFADDKTRSIVEGYSRQIAENIKYKQDNDKYSKALSMLHDSCNFDSIISLKYAKEIFQSLSGFKDANEKSVECTNKIIELATEETYSDDPEKIKDGIKFLKNEGYDENSKEIQSANLQYKVALQKSDEIKKEKQLALAKEKQKKIIIVMLIGVIVLIIFIVVFIVVLNINHRKYDYANSLAEAGDNYNAAIAFNALGGYSDAHERSLYLWNKITPFQTISAGYGTCLGVENNGDVVSSRADEGITSYWHNIVSVSSGNDCYVGIKTDGTVVAAGDVPYDARVVSNWENMVAVSGGETATVGLKADGTVVATGLNYDGQCNVSSWKNIIAVSAGRYHTVGLKADGTVVATGENDNVQCNVSSWKNIIAVSAGCYHTVGLKADGTVVATGSNLYGQCNVSSWKNIVAVSAGGFYTVGLKSDGTVVATGGSDGEELYGLLNWSNIKLPEIQ